MASSGAILPRKVETDAVPTPSSDYIDDPPLWTPHVPTMHGSSLAEEIIANDDLIKKTINMDKEYRGHIEANVTIIEHGAAAGAAPPGEKYISNDTASSLEMSSSSSEREEDASGASGRSECHHTQEKSQPSPPRTHTGIIKVPPEGTGNPQTLSPIISNIQSNLKCVLENDSGQSAQSEYSHIYKQYTSGQNVEKDLQEVPVGKNGKDPNSSPYLEPLSSDSSLSSSSSSSSASSSSSHLRISVIPSTMGYAEVRGIRVNYAEVPTIHPDEYPEELKEPQYDICLIYSEKDMDNAIALKEMLESYFRLSTGEPPKVCMLDKAGTLTYIGSKIKHLEEAMARSTHVFLYLTTHFCEDAWSEMQKDEVLMESINNPEKRWSVVPVYTQARYDKCRFPEKKYPVPFGLKSLKAVDISRITQGEDLADISASLTEKEMLGREKYIQSNLQKMLNDKLSHRGRRERKQRENLERWIREETHRRARDMAQQRHLQNLAAKQRQKEDAEAEMEIRRKEERLAKGESIDGEVRSRRVEARKEGMRSDGGGDGVHYHYHYEGSEGAPPIPPSNQTVINVASATSLIVGNKNTANVTRDAAPAGVDGDDFDPDDLDKDSEVFLKSTDDEIVGLVAEPGKANLMAINPLAGGEADHYQGEHEPERITNAQEMLPPSGELHDSGHCERYRSRDNSREPVENMAPVLPPGHDLRQEGNVPDAVEETSYLSPDNRRDMDIKSMKRYEEKFLQGEYIEPTFRIRPDVPIENAQINRRTPKVATVKPTIAPSTSADVNKNDNNGETELKVQHRSPSGATSQSDETDTKPELLDEEETDPKELMRNNGVQTTRPPSTLGASPYLRHNAAPTGQVAPPAYSSYRLPSQELSPDVSTRGDSTFNLGESDIEFLQDTSMRTDASFSLASSDIDYLERQVDSKPAEICEARQDLLPQIEKNADGTTECEADSDRQCEVVNELPAHVQELLDKMANQNNVIDGASSGPPSVECLSRESPVPTSAGPTSMESQTVEVASPGPTSLECQKVAVASSGPTSLEGQKVPLASSGPTSLEGEKVAVASSGPTSLEGQKVVMASSGPTSLEGQKVVMASGPTSLEGQKVAMASSGPTSLEGQKVPLASSGPTSLEGEKVALALSGPTSLEGQKVPLASSGPTSLENQKVAVASPSPTSDGSVQEESVVPGSLNSLASLPESSLVCMSRQYSTNIDSTLPRSISCPSISLAGQLRLVDGVITTDNLTPLQYQTFLLLNSSNQNFSPRSEDEVD